MTNPTPDQIQQMRDALGAEYRPIAVTIAQHDDLNGVTLDTLDTADYDTLQTIVMEAMTRIALLDAEAALYE